MAGYPSRIKALVSYGENIESLIGYFHTRQHVPFKLMQEIFNDIFHVSISEGGIHYLLNKPVKKALSVYELIKERLLQNTSLAIGRGEAGVKINGKKH